MREPSYRGCLTIYADYRAAKGLLGLAQAGQSHRDSIALQSLAIGVGQPEGDTALQERCGLEQVTHVRGPTVFEFAKFV